MKFKLRTKMAAAFLAVSMTIFLTISVFANIFLERQFTDYVIAKQSKSNRDSVALLERIYAESGNRWDPAALESAGSYALEGGLMLRIADTEGTVLWDAMIHHSGMCAGIIENMSQRMLTHDENFSGGYVEERYPLTVDGQIVGEAAVGYYGPYSFTENDFLFLDALNRMLTLAAAAAAIVSILLGIFMARQLTVPIMRVTGAASAIASGNLKERIGERSSTKEIDDLTASINSLADALDRQECLRKRLTADVAHELRTPLATLQGQLEAMIDGVWAADAERLESCHEEAVRLAKIVASLEELSRYDREQMTLDLSEIDLEALLQRVKLNFESAYMEKGVRLDLETAADPADRMLQGDPDKLRQVFINLLSNALRHTASGGAVLIRQTDASGQRVISVRDTGPGIAASDLPHIFERFYRADRSRDSASGGRGIGLSIAKSIVEAHHGKISAESVPGAGSTFTVRLPSRLPFSSDQKAGDQDPDERSRCVDDDVQDLRAPSGHE